MMNNLVISFIIKRLTEPSTYAGLSGLLATYHIPVTPDQNGAIIKAAMAFGSLVAVFLGETKKA